jgi:hypothetical protein
VESFLRGPRDVLQLRSASNPRRREGKQSIPRERVCHRGAPFGGGRIEFLILAGGGASVSLGQAAKSARNSAPEFCKENTLIFQCLEFGAKSLTFAQLVELKVGACISKTGEMRYTFPCI